jgi:hypothetical protein
MDGVSSDAPRRLRVMADYGADPVWSDWGGEDLNDLPISSRLRRDLRAWAALYDTLPATKFRFQIPGGARGFNDTGERLTQQLAGELGPDWVVTYVPQ